MRYFAVIKYLGTPFKGFQKQPQEKTIQGSIENVLSTILNEEIVIYGSGRTDAGVHALGQTIHFNTSKTIVDLNKFKYSVNKMLKREILFLSLKEVDENFHARLSAKEKTYRYIINYGEDNPLKANLFYFYPKDFDLRLMKKTLKLFVGEHNFQNFTTKDEDFQNFIRQIKKAKIKRVNKTLHIEITSNGFMTYMMRMIVGLLIEVSLKRLSYESVAALFNTSTRQVVNYKAPPEGLYLVKVKY